MLLRPSVFALDTLSSINLAEKRFSPAKLAVMLEITSRAGIDSYKILEGTDINPLDIADPFIQTSSLQFLTAARNAVHLYPHPNLGLEIGKELHVTGYGMYGYALLCSESMKKMFDNAIKFHRLANGMLDVYWVEHDGLATWVFPSLDELLLPQISETLYLFLIDLQFAVTITIIRDVMGPWCLPVQATLMQCKSPRIDAISQILECPLTFNSSKNTVSYPAEWLSRIPQLANPITAAQVSAQCARLLEDFRQSEGISRQVYQELTRVPGYFPNIEQLAGSMNITSRSLRRKLEAEGSSYSQLLTNVRKALAIDYLQTTMLNTVDIAHALGFSDAVAFRHAFKRWTGKSPIDFRRDRLAKRIIK
ncbi:AraC family transcriptional regulator [Acinetobacter pittii]|nr:AraC family transcriptional regulator [Acinetobacter pittii]